MSFTKVAPAGIGTEPGSEIRIGDSLLHSTGLDIGTGSGIGVTIRQHGDATFTGIITASAFFGDGSGLEGVSSSGIGTPLSDDDTSDLNKIYYVNQELSIGSTVTVNHPDSAVASYTHYQDLVVTDDADFIVSDGDTFIPDVLGIRTSTSTASAATGGRIRAGTITNAGANGAVNFPNGLVGTSATFTGVLTYEDVTNVDSIGIVTARGGVRIGTGGTVGPVGSGIVTYYGDGSQLSGIDATKIETGNTKVETIDTGSDGHIKFTTEGSERLRINSNGSVQVTPEGSTSNPYMLIDTSGDSVRFNAKKASGNNEFRFLTQSSGTVAERLRISSDGYVTTPNQPCFDVSKNNGTTSATNPIVYNTVHVNIGSHYDTSNGRFTAPVTGRYLFYFGAIKNNSSAVARLRLRRDGTTYMNSSRELRIDNNAGNYGENGSMTMIVSLNANQYVQVVCTEGNIYNGGEYVHFGGYLLS